jgi:site-specific DNA recombinase
MDREEGFVTGIGFYARVSSDEQREQQTVRNQLEYARSRAALEGWLLQEFVDDGVSGTIPLERRPAGAKLLAAARAGAFEVVATMKIDRLGRTQRVVLSAIDLLKSAGVRYRSLTEPFEVGTPFGDAALGMTSVFAQLERDSIAQRTRDGRRRVAREPGRYLGGTPPYGYRVENKHLVLDEDQAAVVREIYRLYLAGGLGVDAIAAELNRRAIPAKHGGKWNVSVIGRLLRLSRSRGIDSFAGVEREIPAIVSATDFARVRERAAANYKWKRAHERRGYLFRGMLRCECGLTLTAHTYDVTRDGSKTQKAYRCSYDHRLSTPAPKIKEDQALEALWSDVARFFADPDELVRRIVATDTLPAEKGAEQELVALAARRQEIDSRESRLLDAHLATTFSPLLLKEKADQLQSERAAIEVRMRAVRAARNAAAVAVQETKSLRARLLALQLRVRTADDTTKAAVLRELIRDAKVEHIGKQRARLTVTWAFAGAAAVMSDNSAASASSRYSR